MIGNIFRLVVLITVLYLVFTNMTEITQFFDVPWTKGMKAIRNFFH